MLQNAPPAVFILCPFCVTGGKDKNYGNLCFLRGQKRKTYFDVPEDECTIMIQADYERRLREADYGEEGAIYEDPVSAILLDMGLGKTVIFLTAINRMCMSFVTVRKSPIQTL